MRTLVRSRLRSLIADVFAVVALLVGGSGAAAAAATPANVTPNSQACPWNIDNPHWSDNGQTVLFKFRIHCSILTRVSIYMRLWRCTGSTLDTCNELRFQSNYPNTFIPSDDKPVRRYCPSIEGGSKIHGTGWWASDTLVYFNNNPTPERKSRVAPIYHN